MAEKRGETEKLKFDFDTAGCLEIFMNEKWYRVTSREFRSFDGPRRITKPTDVQLGNVDIPLVTEEYWGPVYMFGTNKLMTFTNSGSLFTGELWDKARRTSEERGR